MNKYKLGAVIPTVQFGNMQPVIELEGEDLAQLHEIAHAFIQDRWKEYGGAKLETGKGTGKVVKTFTGEEIIYDDAEHKYTDLLGNPLLSGSAYAEKQGKQFNAAMMIPRTAKSWGVLEQDLEDLWRLNAKISTEYGSAIHTALEVYHRFWMLGAKVQDAKNLNGNYCLPKNAHVRAIVEQFVERFGAEAMPEVFVSDVTNRRVGQIDRLQIIDPVKQVCRVGDYKTNNDLTPEKLLGYQHQLSFYAHILMAKGWSVEGLDIYHYGDEWVKTELEVLDLVMPC